MITILPKGTRLYLGNESLVIAEPEGAAVDFENIGSHDALAEMLAGNIKVHGPVIDLLAHEEEVERPKLDDHGRQILKRGVPEMETVKVHVSYGAGGVRIERDIEEADGILKEQEKNVRDADRAAEKAAKDAEKEAAAEAKRAESAAEENRKRSEELQQQQDAQRATQTPGAPDLRQPTGEPPPPSNTTAPLDAPGGTQAFTTKQPSGDPVPESNTTAALDAPGGPGATIPDTREPGSDAMDEQDTPKLDKPKGRLPDSFPGRAALASAEPPINTYHQLSKRLENLTEIPGIGPATASQIQEAYEKASDSEKEEA